MRRQTAAYAALATVACAFAVAAGDYALFAYHQHRGTAVGSVTVRQYLATPLKNGRDELDFLGESDEPCARAMLPHQQMPPCWWVRQHKDRWVQS